MAGSIQPGGTGIAWFAMGAAFSILALTAAYSTWRRVRGGNPSLCDAVHLGVMLAVLGGAVIMLARGLVAHDNPRAFFAMLPLLGLMVIVFDQLKTKVRAFRSRRSQ